MSMKNILKIKDYFPGGGDLSLDIGNYAVSEKSVGAKKHYKLIAYRKPDQYSSRLGMMAHLNKTNNTLAWGFLEMSLTTLINEANGDFKTMIIYSFFDGIAVANSRASATLEEELTFVSNKKSELCFGVC
jgi:hypothetical protein